MIDDKTRADYMRWKRDRAARGDNSIIFSDEIWQAAKELYGPREVELDAKFVEGAEAFRKMMLEATKAYMWPYIEAVFAVFAQQNNFEPKKIVDELIATKATDIGESDFE